MRITIKVGTSTLTYPTGMLNIRHIEALCKILSDIKNAGHEVILVSSGAIAMGVGKLGLKERPNDIPTKQAAAAVGQCELMYVYDKQFAEYNHMIAQVLLTGSDVRDEVRCNNFHSTMSRLFEMGVLPIINENDTVGTEEIGIGDNDTLGAIVAVSTESDLLVLLSDIDGLYTADPHKDVAAKLIPVVEELTDDIKALGGNAGSEFGTGGMATKLKAAEMCMEAGCDMVIANGALPDILYRIVEGEDAGTRFLGRRNR